MAKIQNIIAREILDSRGNPTVEVKVELDSGVAAKAAVPSGASVGAFEAIEMRDKDETRYFGKGVLKAVNNVNKEIKPEIVGQDANDQREIDQLMIDLDGKDNKSVLGANAILGVSLAVCRAAAIDNKMPLYEYIAKTYNLPTQDNFQLPVPMFNILNGGAHSDSGLSIQEFKVVPLGLYSFAEQLRAGSEIFHTLKKQLADDEYRTLVGDEGGFAPRFDTTDKAYEYILKAVTEAGYVLGAQIGVAIDAASNFFYNQQADNYQIKPDGKNLSKKELIELYKEWMRRYHLISIEDGIYELDWDGWEEMFQTLTSSAPAQKDQQGFGTQTEVMLVGDDLIATNVRRLREAIEKDACNAMIVKVNQIGSLSETIDCMQLAHENNIKLIVSHRSGETTDDFIADLAVAAGAQFIKTGAPSRGERLAKYNRLLEIEEELKR